MVAENNDDNATTVIPPPSPWILRHGGKIRPGGMVLDLACGSGRHSRWALEQGLRVLAVDIDSAKMRDLQGRPGLEIMQYDLEKDLWPFLTRKFDAIIVTNYLHRPLFSHLVRSLEPGGLLIYETFARGHEKYGRPNNPNFLLGKDELLNFFSHFLEIVEFETITDLENGPAVRQRLCAKKVS